MHQTQQPAEGGAWAPCTTIVRPGTDKDEAKKVLNHKDFHAITTSLRVTVHYITHLSSKSYAHLNIPLAKTYILCN